MIADRFSMVLSFYLIIVFILTGCTANRADSALTIDSTPTRVRILIHAGPQPYTLIELIYNSTFEVTMFIYSLSENPPCEDVAESLQLDDFILIDPKLYIAHRHSHILESGYIVHRILSKTEVELSQNYSVSGVLFL